MTEPVLRLEGLRKNFGSLVVTDDVTLDILPGEMHAIIGPNGAGKTTLINQISGLIPPDDGKILFAGADVTPLPPERARCAGCREVFRSLRSCRAFQCWKTLRLLFRRATARACAFSGAPPTKRRSTSRNGGAEQTGIADRAHLPASELSHGEKRALELAIALAMKPTLLLLDEPMAGIGREETERLVALLLGLKGQFTMILVEHDMAAVFALADRISVLIRGRVLTTGSPQQVRTDPQVVAAYLGEQME